MHNNLSSRTDYKSINTFGEETLRDFAASRTVLKYLGRHNDSKNTQRLYANFLRYLALYATSKRGMSTDQLVSKLQSRELEVYDTLQDVLNFLTSKEPAISHNTKIHAFKVITTFLEFHDESYHKQNLG